MVKLIASPYMELFEICIQHMELRIWLGEEMKSMILVDLLNVACVCAKISSFSSNMMEVLKNSLKTNL